MNPEVERLKAALAAQAQEFHTAKLHAEVARLQQAQEIQSLSAEVARLREQLRSAHSRLY